MSWRAPAPQARLSPNHIELWIVYYRHANIHPPDVVALQHGSIPVSCSGYSTTKRIKLALLHKRKIGKARTILRLAYRR